MIILLKILLIIYVVSIVFTLFFIIKSIIERPYRECFIVYFCSLLASPYVMVYGIYVYIRIAIGKRKYNNDKKLDLSLLDKAKSRSYDFEDKEVKEND